MFSSRGALDSSVESAAASPSWRLFDAARAVLVEAFAERLEHFCVDRVAISCISSR